MFKPGNKFTLPNGRVLTVGHRNTEGLINFRVSGIMTLVARWATEDELASIVGV